jgi:kynurenine formamidase
VTTTRALDDQWLDCSQPLGAATPVPPGTSAVDLHAVRTFATSRMSMQRLCVLTHQGTHVDAPAHFVDGGAQIDQVPLGRLSGRVTVLELARERLVAISAADLVAAGVPADHMVFVKTGWGAYYTEPRYWEAPFLDASAAQYLLERGVRALGVDLLSPDEPAHAARAPGFAYPVHHALLGAGVPIIENLNLQSLAAGTYEGVAFPIRIEGGDGAPCRVAVRAVR